MGTTLAASGCGAAAATERHLAFNALLIGAGPMPAAYIPKDPNDNVCLFGADFLIHAVDGGPTILAGPAGVSRIGTLM